MQWVKWISVAVMSVALLGCAKEPADVAETFYDALGKGNVAEAKAVSTEATIAILDLIVAMNQVGAFADKDYTVVDQTIDGDTAIVTLKSKQGETEKVNMIKVEDEWKIHQSKN